MKRLLWVVSWAGLPAQPVFSDSLRQLFQRDFTFDIVIGRTFPVLTTLTDTFPLVPLLSGHIRLGVSWHFRLRRGWQVALQPGYVWGRQLLRATTASVAPYAELMPQGYRVLKYRFGAVYLQTALRWERLYAGELFPRFWVEGGGWLQRQVGSSLKYVAVREGRTERVRWEGVSLFHPWQGGAYLAFGRQWIGATVYYHLLPVFRRGMYEGTVSHPYPSYPRWEVGFLVAL